MMGRNFEVQGSQQQPAGTIAQVNRFDVFLPAERCSIHCHLDHLKSNHSLHLCLMHRAWISHDPTVWRTS